MSKNKPWEERKKCPVIILCLLFAMWFFIVPGILGIYLYIRNVMIDKKSKNQVQRITNTEERKADMQIVDTHICKNENTNSDTFTKGKSLFLFPDNFIVLDIETTGLSKERDEIIEVSALKVEKNNVVDIYSTLIKPVNLISDFITGLTGISNIMVKNAPNFYEIEPNLRRFLGDSLIMGHNISFDIGFLCNAFSEPFTNDYVDTLRLSRKLLPELEHHKLETLANYFNISYAGAHRTEQDCLITFEVYKCLSKLAAEKYGSTRAAVDVLFYSQTSGGAASDYDFQDIKDCIKFISTTANPEVFFKRLHTLEGYRDNIERSKRKRAYYLDLINQAKEILNNKQRTIYNFLERYYKSVDEKAQGLKTDKGKRNQYEKFYKSLQNYYAEMDSDNIKYVETKYAESTCLYK